MYACESWTIKKSERWRIDAFELWCWRILESPLDRKGIKAANPKENQSWIFIGRTDTEAETLATWWEELTHWKRPWCWERLRAGGERDSRGWDGWVASLTQLTWVWARSGSWWWTGKPSMLQSMGSQRVGHDWTIELNWTEGERFISLTSAPIWGPASDSRFQKQSLDSSSNFFFFNIVAFWTVNCHSLIGGWCQEGKLGQITGKIWVRRSRELPSLKDTNNRVISPAVILVSSLRPVPSLFGAFAPLSSCISLVDFLRSQERAHYCGLVPDWGGLTLRCWILRAGSVVLTDSC